jgi:hypothetical protein
MNVALYKRMPLEVRALIGTYMLTPTDSAKVMKAHIEEAKRFTYYYARFFTDTLEYYINIQYNTAINCALDELMTPDPNYVLVWIFNKIMNHHVKNPIKNSNEHTMTTSLKRLIKRMWCVTCPMFEHKMYNLEFRRHFLSTSKMNIVYNHNYKYSGKTLPSTHYTLY